MSRFTRPAAAAAFTAAALLGVVQAQVAVANGLAAGFAGGPIAWDVLTPGLVAALAGAAATFLVAWR